MRFIVVVPARLASTRLPRKPLADIGGKPMVVRVAERALESGAAAVWVAADSVEVIEACAAHGIKARLTRQDHPSGTDRIAEVAEQLGLDDDAIVVNVQGDEPLIDPALISAVAATLAREPLAAIATAAHPIHRADDFFSANVVKVVCDAGGMALYFSRAPIPWARDAFAAGTPAQALPATLGALRHIGIYAYRVSFLHAYASLAPSPLEQVEALEQLRAMAHGYRIAVHPWAGHLAPGVDTPQDLARAREAFK